MTILQLPNKWIRQLINLPETGMGYQLVKVILKNGKELPNYKVINGSMLMLEKDEKLTSNDIAAIEIE